MTKKSKPDKKDFTAACEAKGCTVGFFDGRRDHAYIVAPDGERRIVEIYAGMDLDKAITNAIKYGHC